MGASQFVCFCVGLYVCMCAQGVKVCVSWDYFQYSRIFVYPQAHCLQTASQNDLELIAPTSMCVSAGCTCACVYTMCILNGTCVCVHSHTHTMCLGSDPLLPQALSVWLHKALQRVCVCVSILVCLCCRPDDSWCLWNYGCHQGYEQKQCDWPAICHSFAVAYNKL